MSFFTSESKMQEWLSNELENAYGLSDIIINCDTEFTGDSLAEKKIIDSYKHCMNSLHITEVLSEDKNISLKKGDVLRPDFLLYAAETESMVIIELKNIANPTRQVGTEIGAYASEIKSYIPFIADGDIVNVIISNDWPTLLRHYLFNEIFWNNRYIICLEPVKEAENIKLKIKTPNELVEDDSLISISENHIGGYQICLYDYNLYSGGSRNRLDEYLEQMKTAIQGMSVKGNSLNGHGFAFLWKDHREHSLAPYSITLMNFAAFQSLERFVKHDFDNLSNTTKKFMELIPKFCPTGQSQTHDVIADYGIEFLKKICRPMAEGYHDWGVLKDFMLHDSDLISFHGWGMFGELYSNMLMTEYDKGNTDISSSDPNLGLELLNQIIDPDYEFINLSNIVEVAE